MAVMYAAGRSHSVVFKLSRAHGFIWNEYEVICVSAAEVGKSQCERDWTIYVHSAEGGHTEVCSGTEPAPVS